MLGKIVTKIFGSRNERAIRRMRKVVAQINQLEPEFEKLTDDELKAKTDEFRERLKKVKKKRIFYLKLLPLYVKQVNVFLVCVTLTYSLLAVWY